MLHLSPIYLESAADVYADLFESRLFQERLSSLGHWRGRGANPLGLKNPVELKALEHLLAGFTPDGSKALVADAGDRKRIAGWRASMIADPQVNNLWAVAPTETRVRIERGFVQGVSRTLRRWEDMVTGVGTMVPRSEDPKAIMAVFRTNAAPDTSAQLQATAMLMNVGLVSLQKATTFSPGLVMGSERQMGELFDRALTSRLNTQLHCIKGFAGKGLKYDHMLKEMADRIDRDSDSRSTWARRDERGIWIGGGDASNREWQANARDLARVSKWTAFADFIGKPGEYYKRIADEFRSKRRTNGHQTGQSQDSSGKQEEQVKQARRFATQAKAKKQFQGYSH